MALKPEISIGVGLATAALTAGVYLNATPPLADIRQAMPGDRDVASTRRQAAWLSAAVVAGVSLIAKDATVFILGGSMVIALDWYTRHADVVHPNTGRATPPRAATATQENAPGDFGYAGDLVTVG